MNELKLPQQINLMTPGDIANLIMENVAGSKGICWLLIDTTLMEQYEIEKLDQTLNDYIVHPVCFRHPELEGETTLLLVKLDNNKQEDAALFRNSILNAISETELQNISAGKGRSICGWISTDMGGSDLAEDIAGLAIQQLPRGNTALIRFFDPAVIGLFLSVIDPWQKTRLLKNINVWGYIDGGGQPCFITGEAKTTPKLHFALELTAENQQDIQNIAYINQVLCHYRSQPDSPLLNESLAGKQLLSGLAYFSSLFSYENNGQVDFCNDILTICPHFYRHPRIKKYFNAIKKQSFPSYQSIRKYITEEDWQAVITDTDKTEPLL